MIKFSVQLALILSGYPWREPTAAETMNEYLKRLGY